MSFIFGGNTGKTYEQLLKEREYLKNIQQNTQNTSDPLQNMGLALGRLGTSYFQGQNASDIARQEKQQQEALMSDFSSLNTPAIKRKMAENVQGPPIPQELIPQQKEQAKQERNQTINRMMLNPALERNPNANNIFGQMMKYKIAGEAPLTKYQERELNNQENRYAFERERELDEQNFKKQQFNATREYQNDMLALERQEKELNRSTLNKQDEKEVYKRSQDFYKMFNKDRTEYDSFNTKMRQIENLEADFKENKNLTGPQAYALAMNVGKILDPESVFQSGELATLSRSGDAYQGFLNAIQGIQGQQSQFTPEMLKDLFGLVDNLRGAVNKTFFEKLDDYGAISERYDLPLENVLGDKNANMYRERQKKKEEMQRSNEKIVNDPNSLIGMPTKDSDDSDTEDPIKRQLEALRKSRMGG